MKLLRNYNKGNEYLEMESEKKIQKNYDSDIIGWFNLVNGIVSGIAVLDNKLFLLWDKKKCLITDFSLITLKKYDEKSSLRIFEYSESGELIVSFIYEVDEDFSGTSPFEYIDYEEYDWGYFLSKVVNDKKRRNTIIENLGNLSK